tara:strand:- start:103 stop:405 length:303 start_codon:yes stop_codon:yes gene_type:complete
MKHYLLIVLFVTNIGCTNFKFSKHIDKEQYFNFKARSNLYFINDKSKIINKFIKYAKYEHIARETVKKECLDFVYQNNLEKVKCQFMGTNFTEKISTSLN